MPDPITWYFDPISPFAYLALPTVERLAERHAVTYRPIVFGAVLAHCGQLGPAEIPAKRVHTYRLCQYLADTAGACRSGFRRRIRSGRWMPCG